MPIMHTPKPKRKRSRPPVATDITPLDNVCPQGRIDALLYGLAKRGLGFVEDRYNLVGVVDNAMPHVEELIREYVPSENVLPKEINSLLEIVRQNAGKFGG